MTAMRTAPHISYRTRTGTPKQPGYYFAMLRFGPVFGAEPVYLNTGWRVQITGHSGTFNPEFFIWLGPVPECREG